MKNKAIHDCSLSGMEERINIQGASYPFSPGSEKYNRTILHTPGQWE